MAKSSRASNKKANNVRLKNRVFGPVEDARTERLSAKLLELASQPQPSKQELDDFAMETENANEGDVGSNPQKDTQEMEEMEVDRTTSKAGAKAKAGKSRIEKRRTSSRSKASIIFPKYKSRSKAKK